MKTFTLGGGGATVVFKTRDSCMSGEYSHLTDPNRSTAPTRKFVLRILLVLGVLYCSYSQYPQYSDLQHCPFSQYSAVFRPPILQNSHYSGYELYSIPPRMLGVSSIPGASVVD